MVAVKPTPQSTEVCVMLCACVWLMLIDSIVLTAPFRNTTWCANANKEHIKVELWQPSELLVDLLQSAVIKSQTTPGGGIFETCFFFSLSLVRSFSFFVINQNR